MSTSSLAETPKQRALVRPSFIKEGDVRGTENITSADIKPPALRIAQGTTPEIKRANPAVYIEGLRVGEMFNSSSREIFGEGPIDLVIINELGSRHIQFAPQSEGGGVIDFDVPDDDPRTKFTETVIDGVKKRAKPVATQFYDYLVLVTVDGRRILMTLSMKSTQIKNAKQLNATLLGSKMPSFAHLFKASAVAEKRGAYNFYGWRIDPAGYVTEDVYNEASALYDKMLGKTVVVETEGVQEGEGVGVPDEDIPF